MSSLLFILHQNFRNSFLSSQKLDKNYVWVKIKLIIGKPKFENIEIVQNIFLNTQ